MTDNKLKNIWQRPIYLPYLQPDLTNELVQEAESIIGYKLPASYIELLKTQNGGYIRYKLNLYPHNSIFGIGPHYPSITKLDWTDLKEYVSFELEGLVPFDGDGHWYLCFDFRKNSSEPQITYIDTESDSEEVIAENFPSYLSQLKFETDGEFVIQTNEPIDIVVEKIAKTLMIEFEEPDYYAHGYPQYRSSYKGEWIWVNPNNVPKGFIREDEDRYDELKHLMNVEASRFPEMPITHLLISFSSDEIREELIKKLKQNSFVLTPLQELI